VRQRVWLAALAATMAVAACAPPASNPDPSSNLSGSSLALSGVAIGSPAPDFTLETLDPAEREAGTGVPSAALQGSSSSSGGEVSLSDFRGRPVFINFWASWCAPCREEMPDIVEAYNRHRDVGLVVLAIDNTQLDVVEDVRAFVKEFRMPFPVLLDEEGAAVKAFGVPGLPTSVFIDKDGFVRGVNVGPLTEDTLAEHLANILP
jgi:thiol-disulfide isomerase/thioredoxin